MTLPSHSCFFLMRPLLLPLLLILSYPVQAAGHWSGEGSFGASIANGNTKNSDIHASLTVTYQRHPWQLETSIEGAGSSESGQQTAENYSLNSILKLAVSRRGYLFLDGRHISDGFSSFARQSAITLGYGHTLFDTELHRLSAELGPGIRHSVSEQLRVTDTDTVTRFFAEYTLQLTDNTEASYSLLAEYGASDDFTENNLSLKVAMNEHFALQIALRNRYNSEIETGSGNHHNDILSTVSLVYQATD